ncbi:MAG: hypothetical protein E7515_04765 [Ruminococcaceae bacterium]|jgi:Tfp pilus assembly protein PilX|nr:hypothetical protein [Oscillospiraceae bacterium]
MKADKKLKINLKSGMALPSVLIILMIVSVLGTAMYAYSMQSVRSVRFASDAKKAEYLARAGVESAAFAYQQATNQVNKAEVNSFFNELGKADTNKIVSNDIYLVWSDNNYKYVLASQIGEYEDRNVIGYFKVTIDEVSKKETINVANFQASTGSSGDTVATKINETTKDIETGIKIFTSIGYAGESSRTRTAYLDNSVLCSGLYYGEDGLIDGKYTDEGTYGGHTTALNTAGKPFTQSGSYKTASSIQFKWKWLSNWFPRWISNPDPVTVASETIPFSLAYSAGNMVLNAPSDDNSTLTFVKNQSNFVSFVAMNNLFVQANVDTEPSNGRFNSIVFKGAEVAIDGNVDLYAYGFTRTTSGLSKNVAQLNDMLSRKYRYGTVTVACLDGYSADNRYNTAPYNYGRSGKVYFGGNVYVNITMPNVGTYRYRAFSSGDVYYFDADYKNTRKTLLGLTDGTLATDAGNGGIDLFRYFLEKSIATNKYSRNVLGRFSDVLDFYYGNSGDEKTLTVANGTATRAYVQYKIDSNGFSTGEILYDAMREIDNSTGNEYGDRLVSIIPPNPGDASALKWGKPEVVDD